MGQIWNFKMQGFRKKIFFELLNSRFCTMVLPEDFHMVFRRLVVMKAPKVFRSSDSKHFDMTNVLGNSLVWFRSTMPHPRESSTIV